MGLDFARMPAGVTLMKEDTVPLEDFTLDMIIEAYRKTDLGVLIGGFRDHQLRRACPAAAVAIAHAGEGGTVNLPHDKGPMYFHGFSNGFDGEPPLDGDELTKLCMSFPTGVAQYHRGYDFGQEVREAYEAGAFERAPDYPPELEKPEVVSLG